MATYRKYSTEPAGPVNRVLQIRLAHSIGLLAVPALAVEGQNRQRCGLARLAKGLSSLRMVTRIGTPNQLMAFGLFFTNYPYG
jgi:hypothetical protein